MNALEILKNLHWSDILPDLIKVRDGQLLCNDINEKSSFNTLLDGRLKDDAWYLLLRDELFNILFEDIKPPIAARILYLGKIYLCIVIEN